MRALSLSLFLVCACAAEAGVYQCRSPDGSLRFQDIPCRGAGKLTNINPRPAADSNGAGLAPGTYEMSRRHQDKVSKGLKARKTSGQALKTDMALKREVQNAIRGRQVIRGMTDSEARQSWGPPSEIRHASSGDRWIYQRGGRRYGAIKFDRQGIVSSASRLAR